MHQVAWYMPPSQASNMEHRVVRRPWIAIAARKKKVSFQLASGWKSVRGVSVSRYLLAAHCQVGHVQLIAQKLQVASQHPRYQEMLITETMASLLPLNRRKGPFIPIRVCDWVLALLA